MYPLQLKLMPIMVQKRKDNEMSKTLALTAVFITMILCITLCFVCVQIRGCEVAITQNNQAQKQWYLDNGYTYTYIDFWVGHKWVKPESEAPK